MKQVHGAAQAATPHRQACLSPSAGPDWRKRHGTVSDHHVAEQECGGLSLLTASDSYVCPHSGLRSSAQQSGKRKQLRAAAAEPVAT